MSTIIIASSSGYQLMECPMLNLCEHPCWSSCQGFSDMVISLDNMVDRLSDVKLQPTKDKVVKANEVLVAGHQPRPIMETIIVTLLYLALHSEKIELERELVAAVLDNLSKKLQYNSKSEYIGELIASIIFFWVQCGVSLAALVETREPFVLNVEASNFIQYCYRWLLPALVLHNDVSNLNWVAKRC
ncbi:hypothetical protein Lser_V15G17923 [Lactuca serriola]